MKRLVVRVAIRAHFAMLPSNPSTPSARIAVGSSTTARFVENHCLPHRKSAPSV